MARILLLDRDQYNQDVVKLFRGDRWAVDMQVVDRVGGVDKPVDLSGASVTACFPSTGDSPVAAACTLTSGFGGMVRAVVDEDTTPLVSLTPMGSKMYAVVEDLSDSPWTAETPHADLEVADRDFDE